MTSSENKKTSDEICEDCGAVVAGGKVACVRLFEETIAKEFSNFRYGKIHRLTVDAYCLQHPEPYMRSGKSFTAHLTGMCVALEYEDVLAVNQMVQKWLSTNPKIEKPLQLNEQRGNLTISYIRDASDADEHGKRVREWAQDVWNAWSEHRALAKQLITEAENWNNKR